AADEREFTVTFEPAKDHHLYAMGPTGTGIPVSARGDPAPGVTWKDPVAPASSEAEVHAPYEVRVAYGEADTKPRELSVLVSWQACLDETAGGMCFIRDDRRFTLHRSGATATISESL